MKIPRLPNLLVSANASRESAKCRLRTLEVKMSEPTSLDITMELRRASVDVEDAPLLYTE
jgi:hypothetical protein